MGIEQVPIRYPREAPAWFVEFFQRFIRDVLANADVRNAIQGNGVSIESTPDQPATLNFDASLDELLDAGIVLAAPESVLPNGRVLTGESGVVSVTDGGAGGALNVGLTIHGVSAEKLRLSAAWSVLGNDSNASGEVADISAAANDLLLRVRANELGFGLATPAMIETAASKVILARNTASAGPVEEITLTQLLDFVGSAATGDILYRAAGGWARLAIGATGNALTVVAGLPAWGPAQLTDSGTYTPTISSLVNVASVTPDPFTWMRVGNTVHVFGRTAVSTVVSGGDSAFRFTLPVASTFTASGQIAGTGRQNIPDATAMAKVIHVGIRADFSGGFTGLGYASLWHEAAASVTGDLDIHFSYRVI
jgi:hypothetical protein